MGTFLLALKNLKVLHFDLTETAFEGVEPDINLPLLQIILTVELVIAELRHAPPDALRVLHPPQTLALGIPDFTALAGRLVPFVVTLLAIRVPFELVLGDHAKT